MKKLSSSLIKKINLTIINIVIFVLIIISSIIIVQYVHYNRNLNNELTQLIDTRVKIDDYRIKLIVEYNALESYYNIDNNATRIFDMYFPGSTMIIGTNIVNFDKID